MSIRAVDSQVSLSFQEVNPLNLLEAKILAVPVLTTPAGGSPEQMVADGIDGFALKAGEEGSRGR